MDRKTILVGVFAFSLVGIAGLGGWLFKPAGGLHGTVYADPYTPAPQTSLMREDGSSFQLDDLRGNIILLVFGYTSCPDVCPTTLAELKTLIGSLDSRHSRNVKVILVSVDAQGSPATGYVVDHTARVTLIGQDGNLRSSSGYQTPVEDLAHDLKLLLE